MHRRNIPLCTTGLVVGGRSDYHAYQRALAVMATLEADPPGDHNGRRSNCVTQGGEGALGGQREDTRFFRSALGRPRWKVAERACGRSHCAHRCVVRNNLDL